MVLYTIVFDWDYIILNLDSIGNCLAVTSADVAEVTTVKQISMNVKVPLDQNLMEYAV